MVGGDTALKGYLQFQMNTPRQEEGKQKEKWRKNKGEKKKFKKKAQNYQ